MRCSCTRRNHLIQMFDGEIMPELKYLKVENGKYTSYQAFLALSHMPDTIYFPGNEWLYLSQKLDFGAEICIHVQATDYRESLRRLDKQRREINSQIEHVSEASADMPEDLVEGRNLIDFMEGEVKQGHSPILNTCITFCVSADNLPDLESRVSVLENVYKDINFILERPRGDQLKLFFQHMPTVIPPRKYYALPRTVSNLASGVIGATRSLGDNSGRLLGFTGREQKAAFLYMGLACLNNKSASATMYGNLGGGKSFAGNTLICNNVLYGGYSLIFCPKGERKHWAKELTLFKDCLNLVSISPEKGDAGKLDPYNIYRNNLTNANELAISVLAELFNLPPSSDDYIVLQEAVQRINDGSAKPSMLKLAGILEQFDESDSLCATAKKFARRIRANLTGKSSGIIGLLFGDGSEGTIAINNRLNVIMIENLKLPDKNSIKEDFTIDEITSTVVMMVLAHFAKKFAHQAVPGFKQILFDESWALGKTTEGKKLYEYLARMGRSLNTGIIFNGHSVLDISSKELKNTITYKFCFKADDEEAGRMLEYLEMEDTPDNRKIIKTLKNGQCLFKDADGHIGVITIESVLEEYKRVFDTTPKPQLQVLTAPISPEPKNKTEYSGMPMLDEKTISEVLSEKP